MPFTPGTPKPPGSGRTKNSPTKLTLQLMEKCNNAQFDPVMEFLKRYQQVDDDAKACELILKLMEYIYPKRTRIEGELDLDPNNERQPITINQENIIQLVQVARGSIAK